MRKTSLLIAAVVLGASAVAYWACPGQSRQVVGEKELGGSGGAGGGAVSFEQVDHGTWDRLLKRYVDRDGMVDYAAWKASQADRAALQQYLASLSRADPEAGASQESRLAFWINAYNALTVHGILEVYPTSSIRNHTAAVFGYNIWKDLLLRVGGEDYSLNDIEHKILRKQGEPRIHFAIVCASIGCPRLLNEAYTARKLQTQLAGNTRDFFRRRKNFQADFARRQVRVSSILDWFGEDFGPSPQKALARLAPYMPDERTRELVASQNVTIAYLDYDWSLNKQ